MFTFVIFSYNQEEYIIEHLESIRYQIEHYGNGRKIHLIISDDHSTDRTIKFAKLWLDARGGLFEDVQILVSEENQGIVKNYLNASAPIQTPYYKLLGGDDLYSRNNVFETLTLLEENEIVYTPALTFNEQGVNLYWDVNNLLTIKTPQQVRDYLKYGYPFNPNGIFYKTSLIQHAGLRKYLSQYKWIEDLPSIYYVFNEIEHLNYAIDYTPYVIYRNKVGISNNAEHERYGVFAEEEDRIRTAIGMAKYERGLNPTFVRFTFMNKFLALKANLNPQSREIKQQLKREVDDAGEYLAYIQEQSANFFQTHVNRVVDLREEPIWRTLY